VHAQSHAEALLSTATSPQVYRAVLEQMEQEMQCGEGRAPRACGGRSARGSAAGRRQVLSQMAQPGSGLSSTRTATSITCSPMDHTSER